ncbi:MAG: nucleotidyl transferase AbiEii/AbiGii toxin family protein [Gammaproteobacteria bacterium]|nr:nucleotidyl transferase AbiEii/AbiGii toxin family protein [Gammaproteobacteria bacterium]
MDEENVPEWVVRRLSAVLPVLVRYFPEESLAMGGGTILQARWNHRISTDIDLFTATDVFNSVIRTSAAEMERDLYRISAVNTHRSWVDLSTIYCDVEGTELTVMPSDPLVFEVCDRVVPSTRVKTEASALILNKKIVGRMIGGGAYEIRDIFDLYTAINKDRAALREAIRPIPQRSRDEVSAMLRSLPDRWFRETTKPLRGVANQPSYNTMIDAIAHELSLSQSREDD